ncbi:DUF4867 family protein [Anaerotruncus colihominis]|uniref:DUF4867 family protein n=1 Tax=Anaerotruncus colihominis TaxID=169435 RepID=A0A3E3ISE2_9FIRM|nr:DUF4867 family protein [Anaerotruncus colihominis]OUO68991.1 DUF4867 domain-containing protein [Anaerotruncus colihominis]RGE69990.1 DUF4867 family protein [Anaerotruncus colihominis]
MKSVFDKEFAVYGKVVEGYDFAPLLKVLRENSGKPADCTIYVPSDPTLEALAAYRLLSDHLFGGMPVQIGYCNGHNRKLNCLEYHRNSELNITDDGVVFLVAPLWKVRGGRIDTGEVEAFAAPAKTAVLLYETTLHYAPVTAPGGEGFRVAVVLPRGTNTEKPAAGLQLCEDRLLYARNKWLIAHPDSDEAKNGAFAGLTGDNITIE